MTNPFADLGWARGCVEQKSSVIPNVHTAYYRLSALIESNVIDSDAAQRFLVESGLVDFAWEVTWSDTLSRRSDQLSERFGEGEGYAIFVHGWTGNHSIWESLPALLVNSASQMVAISVDHNGFGDALLADETPPLDRCGPPAAMRTLERWVELLGLRRQADPKVINFIGHSMGGAALFYLDPEQWFPGEETRYAVAPALLLEDELNRVFYTALGIGIGLVNLLPVFEIVERALRPSVIEALCQGSSDEVKKIHNRQYRETPRGTTAATFVAMGLLENRAIAHTFDFFRVILGHRDRLVDPISMLDLLSDMEFPPDHIRVVPGTHYLFSLGEESPLQHAQNRDLIVRDVLNLHQRAYALLQGRAASERAKFS